jgi:N-acetylglucosamine-6-phosphate deacetylase
VALADDRLTADLICDGAHVHPQMVAIAARALGDRLILITDRLSPRPGGDFGSGGLTDDGVVLRLADGRLAGSRLTLDRAIQNANKFAEIRALDAVAACTLRPARLLGIESERGTLRHGARADLVVLDDALQVRETWLGGECVFQG